MCDVSHTAGPIGARAIGGSKSSFKGAVGSYLRNTKGDELVTLMASERINEMDTIFNFNNEPLYRGRVQHGPSCRLSEE